MSLNQIPTGKDSPNDIYVIIEIPAYSTPIKYEIDKKTETIFVNRIMHSTMFYPCNYGYINHTLALDGDPIDVLISTQYPLQIKSVIRCRPVGMLKMNDEAGEDNKIIAVPHHTLSKDYDTIKNVNDLSILLKEQISHFFKYYKKLDTNKWVKIQGWENADQAKNEISSAFQRFLLKEQNKIMKNK